MSVLARNDLTLTCRPKVSRRTRDGRASASPAASEGSEWASLQALATTPLRSSSLVEVEKDYDEKGASVDGEAAAAVAAGERTTRKRVGKTHQCAEQPTGWARAPLAAPERSPSAPSPPAACAASSPSSS